MYPRMTKAEIWTKRIEEWRASGLTAEEFCRPRGFDADRLYRWSSRLAKRAKESPKAEPTISIARVIRRPMSPSVAAKSEPSVCIEIAGARVTVAAGVCKATLASVFEVLEARAHGGAR